MKMKKIFYSWNHLETDIDYIVERVKHFQFRNVYGIPRGGLIPAVLLSHRLNLKLITDPTKISTYTLVIDDISDTGKTFIKLFKKWRRKKIIPIVVTLLVDEKTKFYPYTFARIKTKDRWIVYPWETLQSTK